MTIEQLVPLTDGLSVTACAQTLALDRTRVTKVSGSRGGHVVSNGRNGCTRPGYG